MKKKLKKPDKLTDKQIYAIPENSRIHGDKCKNCRCVSCAWSYTDCRTCAVCLFEARPFTKCSNYEPFIFGSEPYSGYIKELDKNKDKIRLYVD